MGIDISMRLKPGYQIKGMIRRTGPFEIAVEVQDVFHVCL
jgi:hypothetical protein